MTPGQRTEGALVSVLVPCCGQLEYTRLSVPRLLRYSRPAFELVFLDLGSLDGTPDYLAGISDAGVCRVRVVHAPSEADLAGAVRVGLAEARGEFVAWVHNDVLVSEGWLDHLVGLLTTTEVAVAGPLANLGPSEQRIEQVPYRLARPKPAGEGTGGARSSGLDLRALDEFQRRHRETKRGDRAPVDRLGGFCFVAKKAVLEQVPLVEANAEAGVFDADRFFARVRRAGRGLGCCRDLFVHQFGSQLG